MSHLDTFIIDLALIMSAAGIVTVIFRMCRFPVILGYILAGFLISPNFVWLPTVVQMDNIETWANIGIVFLMFGLGLEFSFMKLREVGHAAATTAFTVMAGMIPAGFAVGRLFGWGNMNSIFLGCMLSMSSTMIILKAYEEYELKEKNFASIVLGALVIEDIMGIFLMIVLTTISVSQSSTGVDVALHIGSLILYLVIWLALGVSLIPSFLRWAKKYMNDETLLIVSVAICLGMVVISNIVGFSEALGAFMGGSILAGTVSGERIDKLITPLKDMFGAVFFVSVGMMIEPMMLKQYVFPILVIAVVTIIGQMILATLGIVVSGNSLETSVRGGMSMVQIGEFSFIIATLGNTLNVTSDFLFPIIVCVSVITIITTPIFIKSSEKVYTSLDGKIPERIRLLIKKYTRDPTPDERETSDWKLFLKRFARRTVLTSAALVVIYQASTKVIMPFLEKYFPNTSLAPEVLTVLVTFAAMAPFISLMWYGRSSLFKKMWLQSRYNRLPLMALRVARLTIAVFVLVLTLDKVLGVSKWILIPLSMALVVVIIQSEYLRGRSIKVEMTLIANFNERLLHKRKSARQDEKKWLGDALKVVRFGLVEESSGVTVRNLVDERLSDVLIIKIVRDGKHINMPGPDEIILPGDKVYAMGTQERLDIFLMMLEQAEHIKEPERDPVPIRRYFYSEMHQKLPPEDQIMCCIVPVEWDGPLKGVSIKNSGFKEKYGGFIIGLERHNLAIPDPHIETIMEEGDIIWTLGDHEMADKLLKDGLLTEK